MAVQDERHSCYITGSTSRVTVTRITNIANHVSSARFAYDGSQLRMHVSKAAQNYTRKDFRAALKSKKVRVKGDYAAHESESGIGE